MNGLTKKKNEMNNFEADDCQRISSRIKSKINEYNILNNKKKYRLRFIGDEVKLISIFLVVFVCIASFNVQSLVVNNELNSTFVDKLSIKNEQQNSNDDTFQYEFVLNLQNTKLANEKGDQEVTSEKEEGCNKLTISSVNLEREVAIEFEKKLSKIKNAANHVSNSEKIKEYSRKALDLYMEYNILPECFTYENISDFINQITTSFSIKISGKANNDDKEMLLDDSGLTLNGAAPFSVLSYCNIFGSVKPFGLSYSDDGIFLTALPGLRNLTILNVIINSTGWYIEAESLPEHPLFPRLLEYEISWKIDGPIWSFIWKNLDDEDDYIQFKTFFGIGIYNFFHGLLGNAITLGAFSGPQIDGKEGQFKLNQPFLGNFIWVGVPFTVPFSFTLYKTYPVPWTVGLEIGVVPTLGISVLVSLLYLKPRL